MIVRYCCTGTAILPLDGAVQIARARGNTQSDGAVQMVRYCCTGTAILPLDGTVQIARARGKTQFFIRKLSYQERTLQHV